MPDDDDPTGDANQGPDGENDGPINDPLTHTDVEAPRVPFESPDE